MKRFYLTFMSMLLFSSIAFSQVNASLSRETMLPLCPLSYDEAVFKHIFPTSSITISLKNGDMFMIPHTYANYYRCQIFFDEPTETDGLFLEGCYSLEEEGEYKNTVYVDEKRVEIPKGTLTFETDALSNQSGVLKLINESGKDLQLTINGVIYISSSSVSSQSYEDECSIPGYALQTYDYQTGRYITKQIAGTIYSGMLQHVVSPITTAGILFDYDFKQIGGKMWASATGENVYVAQFSSPVPSPDFKWRYITKSGETNYQDIKQNSLSSVLSVSEPVVECALVYDSDKYPQALSIRSLTLKSGGNSGSSTKGDVNEDKKIDISDIVAIINIIAGK